jgi:hypothetical protein
MLKYALAVGLVGMSISSQESGCPGDAQRAQTAVRFAREVNAAQARYQAQNRRCQARCPLADMNTISATSAKTRAVAWNSSSVLLAWPRFRRRT